ncbi:MAG: ATPase [Lachnospiraceae bacterium]|nr:ATPase [Lachnospiraceae bacterium]
MIEKIKFLRITGPKEDISRVIEQYLNKYKLHVENALSELSDVHNLVPYVDTYNVRETLLKSQDAIEELKKSDAHKVCKDVIEQKMTVEEASNCMSTMHLLLDDLNSQKKERLDQIQELKERKEKIMPFMRIDVPLAELFQYKFIKCEFGRIALEYYEKLMKYVYHDMNTLFLECMMKQGFVYGVYFVPSTRQTKEDAFFSSLHFEEITFPEDMSDTPAKIIQDIDKKIEVLNAEIDDLTSKMLEVLTKHAVRFIHAYEVLKEYNDDAEIRKLAACTKQKDEVYYILCGWMSEEDTKKFRKEIESDQLISCYVDDTTDSTSSTPPTKLKNPKIFKPFEMFIRMYGLPAYGEIDPTVFLAITYSFLFGMMYGDVGQGLCLVIGGYLLYHFKKQNLCAILSCAGVSSTIFGFLYGSVFGFEDVLKPIWVNPMKDTLTVLITAVGFGICLNIFAMILNIINGIREKNIERIFFDTNGVAGLVFYASVIGTALFLVTGHTIKAVFLVTIMIVVPLILIFFKEPLSRMIEKRKGLITGEKGMFFVENGFGMIEVLLSYVTNTISFVRVGAFALSHAGMMSVVLLLSHASSGHPNVIVLVLGNLFVAGLEGLIVGIQVLRLEYYEMFSRFYSGTGKEFKAKK